MKISVVIICYNEKKNLKSLIFQSKKLIKKYKNIEVIFVNNGSSDGSNKVFDKMFGSKMLKLVSIKKNKGYGHGIICGLKKAKGDIIGWTHGDDLNFFYKFQIILNKKLKKNNFFLKGYRTGKRPFLDIFFSYGFNITSSIILRKNLCRVVCFKQYVLNTIFSHSFRLFLS